MYHPFLSVAIKTCTDMSRSVFIVQNWEYHTSITCTKTVSKVKSEVSCRMLSNSCFTKLFGDTFIRDEVLYAITWSTWDWVKRQPTCSKVALHLLVCFPFWFCFCCFLSGVIIQNQVFLWTWEFQSISALILQDTIFCWKYLLYQNLLRAISGVACSLGDCLMFSL